jgi:8-oxo-dGTP diphosphatase
MQKVIAAILEKNGKVLIARRKKDDPLQDKWEFPGGKVEQGETHEACLKRELMEELGINVKVGEFVASSSYAYSHISIELIAYRVFHISGEIAVSDHEEIKWVSVDDLERYDFPAADKPIIDALRHYL